MIMSDSSLPAQFSSISLRAFSLQFQPTNSTKGLIASVSFLTVPTLSTLAPQLQVQQWRAIYRRGASIAPPTALFTSSVLLYASYTSFINSSPLPNPTWKFCAAAVVLTSSIVPYTIVSMMPTNNKLMALAEKADAKGEVKKDEVDRLTQKWSLLNIGRAMFPLLGAGVALYGIMF